MKLLLENAFELVKPLYMKQVGIFLRLKKIKLGYLLKFNEEMMKDGLYRFVNGLEE